MTLVPKKLGGLVFLSADFVAYKQNNTVPDNIFVRYVKPNRQIVKQYQHIFSR